MQNINSKQVFVCEVCGLRTHDRRLIVLCEDGIIRCLVCKSYALSRMPGKYLTVDEVSPAIEKEWRRHMADVEYQNRLQDELDQDS